MKTTRSLQPIPTLQSYFGSCATPVIASTFTPGTGWRRFGMRKRISRSYLRKLRAERVTHVALTHDGRTADFTVAELLRG